MAKNKFRKLDDAKESLMEEGFSDEQPMAAEEAKVVKLEPVISFDAYFSGLGKPPHHKAGMVAFTNTAMKRTKTQWEFAFSKF